MGKPSGFLEYQRKTNPYLAMEKRKKNFKEFLQPLTDEAIKEQGARCMDCGVPFCQQGCPLGNIIPDFNHYTYTGDARAAYEILKSTNNFPNITGRVCPAPCESSCVLGIVQPPVSIKSIEYTIALQGEEKGWLYHPVKIPKEKRTGKKVAVIGSGPAGMASADQLNKAGHWVTVFEKDDEIGGLLTYGIPNFKLDKKNIFAHVERMTQEGVVFKTNVTAGKDLSIYDFRKNFDAIILAVGSTIPRDLDLPQRDSQGIHFAMPFLTQATKKVLGKNISEKQISTKGKAVLVIGGGDTGSDCIGTSIRQGAKSVTQIEILPKPPTKRDESMPWPLYDRIFRVSSSQAEGCNRKFNILTKKFLSNKNSQVKGIEYVEVEWNKALKSFQEKTSNKKLTVDIVFIAMGFIGADKDLASQFKLERDSLGRIKTKDKDGYATTEKGIFIAGDARRGQSLVVWAISEGRECAREVDSYLSNGVSLLPSKNLNSYALDNR